MSEKTLSLIRSVLKIVGTLLVAGVLGAAWPEADADGFVGALDQIVGSAMIAYGLWQSNKAHS